MKSEPTPLQGKRILVTGGTTGIGRATVAQLVQAGAKVLTFGRHQPELDDALAHARACADQGGEVFGLTADVATTQGVQAVFSAVDETLGGLDILVNNAGLAADPAQDESNDDWRYVVDTNFTGYIACARDAILRMEEHGGHLVFVGSISAERQSAGSSVYAATKAAAEAYAKTLRKEVQEKKIKVTLIEPGTTGAGMIEKSPQEQRDAIARHEMLYAEEVADTIHFALTRSERTDISALRVEPLIQN